MRELAVHRRRRDADPLLATRHLQAMELRAIEQLAEDPGDLRPHDPRPVVRDDHAVAFLLDHLLDDHLHIGQDTRLLAGIERIVHRLLDRRQQRLARVIEAQQMAVLREELRHRDLALSLRQLGGRHAASGGGLRLVVGLAFGLALAGPGGRSRLLPRRHLARLESKRLLSHNFLVSLDLHRIRRRPRQAGIVRSPGPRPPTTSTGTPAF